MFKKILPYILSILIAVGIFIGGMYAGIRIVSAITRPTMLQDEFINSFQLISALDYLDQGEVERARQFLLLNQDTKILIINSLAEHADKQFYKTACNILKRIDKNRKENPSKYANYTYGFADNKTDDIKGKIGQILDKWASTSCDKDK